VKIPFLLTAAGLLAPSFLAAQAPVQQGAPQTTLAQRRGPPLPPDDPSLYRLFFGFYDGLIKTVETAQQQSVSAGVKRQRGIAQLLKINESDLAQVTGVSQSFVASLAQWDSDRKTYAEQAISQHQKPELARLKAFDLQRRQLTDASVQRLVSSLPPASWKALRSFINDRFRLQTGVKNP
jgi:hypothetical protein